MLIKPISIQDSLKNTDATGLLKGINAFSTLAIDLIATHEILTQDQNRLFALSEEYKRLKDLDGLYSNARALIRSIFPYIEFEVYWFFHMCLFFEEPASRLLPEDRKKMEDFIENRVEGRMSFVDSFKFAVKRLIAAYELSYSPDFMCWEWQEFQNAILLRDRLMHPKREQDMIIETEKFEAMCEGIAWVMGIVNSLVHEVNFKTKEMLASLHPSKQLPKTLTSLSELRDLSQLVLDDEVELADALTWLRNRNSLV